MLLPKIDDSIDDSVGRLVRTRLRHWFLVFESGGTELSIPLEPLVTSLSANPEAPAQLSEIPSGVLCNRCDEAYALVHDLGLLPRHLGTIAVARR